MSGSAGSGGVLHGTGDVLGNRASLKSQMAARGFAVGARVSSLCLRARRRLSPRRAAAGTLPSRGASTVNHQRVRALTLTLKLMFSIAAPLAMRAPAIKARFRWCLVMLACGNATNTSRGAARCSILRASTRGTSMQTGTEQTHIENTRTNTHTIGNHTRNTQHTHHTRTNNHTPNKREQTSRKTTDRLNAGHSRGYTRDVQVFAPRLS